MTQKYGSLNELSTSPELDEAVKLDTLFGKELTVKNFITIQVGANDCAIFETTDHGKVSSFSKVIIDQLSKMKADLDAGVWFKVRAVKEKNYYKFEEVE